MAKIDLAAITKGLQKVQDKATAMETVAHDELVDADLIHFAENNPYAEQDTPEELAALAAEDAAADEGAADDEGDEE